MQISFVLALLLLAVALFSTEALPVDVVTLLLLVALVVGGVLTPAQAFAGFGSELIVTLLAIFVLSGALRQTGAVAALAERLDRLAGGRETPLTALLLSAVGASSAVMNNTTATAVFLPPALHAAERLRLPPSRLLMPVAFASILGGTCTLVGTSTNLAVSGYLAGHGDPPLTLFELTPVGLTVLPLGILYLLTVGRRLLPERSADGAAAFPGPESGEPEPKAPQVGHRTSWASLRGSAPPAPRPARGWATVAALVAAVVAGGLGWLPLSVAFLSAALVAVLLRAITMQEAYRLVEWKLVVLIAGMTAFGTAMETSGAASFLAGGVVALFHELGPLAVLAGFTLLTLALTQPMSNAAAALVVLPVALSTAAEMGVSDRPFAVAIALAASLSFITPLEPSCLLVYGPGRYRFRDFAVVGGPLTLLLVVVVLAMVPWLWPF